LFLNLGAKDPLLNNATAYFNLDARLITADSTGVYHYFSSRNNDFSNRDQKGQIVVQAYQFLYQLIGQYGYTATLGYKIFIGFYQIDSSSFFLSI
jgi:hypothetical protein